MTCWQRTAGMEDIMNKRSTLRLPLQFFAEPNPGAGQNPTPPAGTGDSSPTPHGTAPLNFDDLIKTDTNFQSWVGKRIMTATTTAVSNAEAKWKKTHDQNFSEAEKLKTMTADEKAEYFEMKYNNEVADRKRASDAAELKSQTAAMFTESKIPAALLDMIDFSTATADSVKAIVSTLSGFEYHKKGDFNAAVKAAVDEKLKQKAPETHKPAAGTPDMRSSLAEHYNAKGR